MIRIFALIVFLIAVMTGVYIALSIFLRKRRQRQLEAEHAAGKGGGLNREDYVGRGLQRYDRTVPRVLIVVVLALPALVFVALVWLANSV